MDDNMANLFNDVQKMVDSGNIPDNIQEMLNNIKNNSNNNSSNNAQNVNSNQNTDINNILNNISPEMLNNFKDMFNSSENTSASSNSNNNNNNNNSMPNIDINTVLKMKSVIEKMNQKDDPRANLLYSLKPYLRDSRKDKVDQYVNLLNMTKIADIMNSKDKNKE